MSITRQAALAFGIAAIAGLIGLLFVSVEPSASSSTARASYYVSPSGDDANSGRSAARPFKTIQKAVDLARPGDVIHLAAGVYLQDVVSRRDGSSGAPITIEGPAGAIVKGGGGAHIFEVNHDNLTLEGFTLDGLWGAPTSAKGYREKLLYVVGRTANDGVRGLRVLHMTFKNAGGECMRLRYFAQHNEVAYSTFAGCGVHDFKFKAGKRNGEGIYIGTAPEQRGNGENPTADPDQSNDNWIHHNTFDTQGNECVDIKEASSGNLVEHNSCTGQRDPNSGGFDARGSGNVIRYNQSYGNAGAGIRLGGDTPRDGVGNAVYGNTLRDNRGGGIKLLRQPQAKLCGNILTGNPGGDLVGKNNRRLDPAAPC